MQRDLFNVSSFFLLFLFFLFFFFGLWFFLLLFFLLWFSISIFILLGVDSFTNFHRGCFQSLDCLLNLLWFFSCNSFIDCSDISVYLIFHILRNLGTMFLQLFLCVINCLIGLILQVNCLSSLLILFFTGFSVLNHSFDISIT